MELTYQQTKELVLRILRGTVREGGYREETKYSDVLRAMGQMVPEQKRSGVIMGGNADERRFGEYTRQFLWELISRGVLVPGSDRYLNAEGWPHFKLTEYGAAVVRQTDAPPYDQEGFMREFDQRNPSADPVIRDYTAEAVRAFNHDCLKSAAVMLGAASEKAILLLHEAFENAIADGNEKARFEKAYRWTISSKYEVLRDRLDKMIKKGTLKDPYVEYVITELGGAFNLIRRERNSAGHPEITGDISRESLLLNLRVMSEYIRRIHELTSYFLNNPAEW